MSTTVAREDIVKKIKDTFGSFSQIRSAYLYGSVLTDAFAAESDVDILFVVDEPKERNAFLQTIKTARESVGEYKLDISILFEDELHRRWHIYRPPTFFIWVKRRGVLLWGTDTLHHIQEEEITAESIYKRAVDLAQSSRSVYLNNKDTQFWETKYTKWLRELACGVLYLQGTLELDVKTCGDKLSVVAPELEILSALQKHNLPIKIVSEIAETIVVFLQKRLI